LWDCSLVTDLAELLVREALNESKDLPVPLCGCGDCELEIDGFPFGERDGFGVPWYALEKAVSVIEHRAVVAVPFEAFCKEELGDNYVLGFVSLLSLPPFLHGLPAVAVCLAMGFYNAPGWINGKLVPIVIVAKSHENQEYLVEKEF
jgi:hypothetical protein